MHVVDLPRVVVAGLTGDSGKSLVSMALARHYAARGLRVAPFKKGPDFIDAAWLGVAARAPGRNLDTYIMSERTVRAAFAFGCRGSDLAVVEGNRGLYDGLDAIGSHSTARLARILGAPVVLVVKVTKVTRTVAAMVLGCQALDPEVNLAGVILNQVGTARQEAVIREAVQGATGLPVLGAIPRLRHQHLPSRHLGLVTADEHGEREEVLDTLAEVVASHVDTGALMAIARRASPLAYEGLPEAGEGRCDGPAVTIGVLRDRAFSFYYPENLEALEAAGARIRLIAPLTDPVLPDIDALYAGGGFPEVHAAELAANRSFRQALAERISGGLPVWAECGGLMYLSRAIREGDVVHPMVGALPIEVEQGKRPQGHGYVCARVDGPNPYLPPGLELRGHEFHYSRVLQVGGGEPLPTVLALSRGTGVGGGRDGIAWGNVFAAYLHIHALGTPEWARAVVKVARGG